MLGFSSMTIKKEVKATEAAQHITEALEASRENNYQTFTKDSLTQFDKKTYFKRLDKILFNQTINKIHEFYL